MLGLLQLLEEHEEGGGTERETPAAPRCGQSSRPRGQHKDRGVHRPICHPSRVRRPRERSVWSAGSPGSSSPARRSGVTCGEAGDTDNVPPST